MKFFTGLALAASVVSALPSESADVEKRTLLKRNLLTFENQQGLGTVPNLAPITLAGKLGVTGFVLDQVGLGGAAVLAGIEPHSGSKYAAFNPTAANVGGNGKTAAITVAGSRPQAKFFYMDSLYLGCALLSAEGAEGVAKSCTVRISGYKNPGSTGRPVVTKDLHFTPSGLLSPQTKFVGFPWTPVQSVKFETIGKDAALNVILVDDVLVRRDIAGRSG